VAVERELKQRNVWTEEEKAIFAEKSALV